MLFADLVNYKENAAVVLSINLHLLLSLTYFLMAFSPSLQRASSVVAEFKLCRRNEGRVGFTLCRLKLSSSEQN
jgi:hypothetical protein